MTKKSKVWAALACTLLLALGMGTAALADTQGTQRVTTSVPDPEPPAAPSWTLHIPADTAIPYGATETPVGTVTVSDVENVPAGKAITCNISNTNLESGLLAIPLGVVFDRYVDDVLIDDHKPVSVGAPALYDGAQPDRTFRADLFALVGPADWAAAAPGYYEAAVTYTSGLVVVFNP